MASIRLRLRIERNELPLVCTLWPIAPAQAKSTIAQLLENVNRTFPLESADWGYEDYAVLISGYECLHYHTIEAVCKDEDEITIRPLQYVDVRARTLTGRDQITRDGRHLLDGVPFGRPALKGPVRPEVNIPARKRKRNELEERDQGQQGWNMPVPPQGSTMADWMRALIEVSADEERERAEGMFASDDPFANSGRGATLRCTGVEEAVHVSGLVCRIKTDDSKTGNNATEQLRVESPPGKRQRKNGSPLPHFVPSGDAYMNGMQSVQNESLGSSGGAGVPPHVFPITIGDDEDNESDEDFFPDDVSESSSSGLKEDADIAGEDSGSESDSSDSGNDEPFEGFPTSAPPTPGRSSQPPTTSHAESSDSSSDTSSSTSDSSSVSSDSDSSSDSSSDDIPTPLFQVPGKSHVLRKPVGVPYTGSRSTRTRNARRRDGKELKALQREHILPPDATLADLRTFKSGVPTGNRITAHRAQGMSDGTMNNMPAPVGASEVASTSTMDHLPAAEASSAPSELERQRQDLLAAINSGGVDVTEAEQQQVHEEAAHSEEDNGSPEELRNPPAPDAMLSSVPDFVDKQKRNKVDMSATQRLIFGSLGVRNPKTAEDRERVQKKLQDRNEKRAKPVLEGTTTTEKIQGHKKAATTSKDQGVEGDSAEAVDWRDVIDLRAVECTDPSIKLSMPPFPFKQRWDPQQQRQRKKNKRGGDNAYSGGGKSMKLNSGFHESYDKYNTDGSGDALDYGDEDHYDPAAAQLQDEAAAGAIDDSFPPLPADLVTLIPVGEAQTGVNDVIIFTNLACDATTKWAPALKTTTAKVLGKPSEPSGLWKLQIAARDLPKKVYDENGERVYDKFEAAGFDEGEEDEGVKELTWAELGEVRLLQGS